MTTLYKIYDTQNIVPGLDNVRFVFNDNTNRIDSIEETFMFTDHSKEQPVNHILTAVFSNVGDNHFALQSHWSVDDKPVNAILTNDNATLNDIKFPLSYCAEFVANGGLTLLPDHNVTFGPRSSLSYDWDVNYLIIENLALHIPGDATPVFEFPEY